MYQSNVDVLYHLYDKGSIGGGYIVVDDWFGFCKRCTFSKHTELALQSKHSRYRTLERTDENS
jgi:Macrocin-O-methyltransferase (TylF)